MGDAAELDVARVARGDGAAGDALPAAAAGGAAAAELAVVGDIAPSNTTSRSGPSRCSQAFETRTRSSSSRRQYFAFGSCTARTRTHEKV